jgi:MscS family membrane protein
MEEILLQKYYHNTLKDWLISLGIILLAILFARFTYLIIGKIIKVFTSKTKTTLDDAIVVNIERPAIMLIILMGIRFSLERLHFVDKLDSFIHRAFILIIALNVTWFVVRIIKAIIEEYLIPYSKRDDNKLDDQMILLIERGVSILFWSVGIILGLNNAGFDVGALIAGLGIGGLALALAAQDTVKNIFGGITIFLDKPFRIGDRIIINGMDGFVEYIGIRSTRLRTLEGRLITIPNAQFSENPIENITIEPARRMIVDLGLTYDTPPEKMELAVQLLKQIATNRKNIIVEPDTKVFFNNFGSYSLGIRFIYFIRKEADLFQTQHIINSDILEQFNKNGLEFAFPTQTIYRKALD